MAQGARGHARGRWCRWAIVGFAAFYLLSVLLLLIGTYGLFGAERDPLAGVFLLLPGLPWSFFTGVLPEAARGVAAVCAPAVNLALLAALCRWRRAR